MSQTLEKLNETIREASPALFALLSPLGRRAIYPPDIPFQAAQARGKAFNATIGQITDGRGGAIMLPTMERLLTHLNREDMNRAFLYSPVEGIPEVRQRWMEWQRRGKPASLASSLPIVTAGLTHGISLAADLFGGEGKPVAIPAPFWGNYRQSFATRTGARVFSAPIFIDGRYNCEVINQALAEVPEGEPAVALLNFPSNPTGYSASLSDRDCIRRSLLAVADHRPLLVVCDDAYSGLVFEPDIPRKSLFWDLIGLHENLVPIKVDGGTKEFSFFGGRVGFVTFPFEPDSPVAEALENKVKLIIRSTIGSPVATSQILLLQALREGRISEQIESVRLLLEGRYRVLKSELGKVDGRLLRPLPFNSGCFALTEMPKELGLNAENVRLHLLATQDAGLISIQPNYLRIAFCSIHEEVLPELVKRIQLGIADLAGVR